MVVTSPLSPNLSLTTPIASSMNVSGLNIDVGNPKAPTSSTWSIPNIYITLIPPNPTNTQMHVSEGPGSTPQISSKANPQSKFPHEFSLILVGIQSHPRVPLDKVNSQPLIFHQDFRFMWAMKSRLMAGNEKDHWKILLGVIWHLKASDELYASSPLVHKEKVTGHHHPYASKPRTAHASSSREKMVDDKDENMSLTQMETNDEQRRDDFTAHEHGTHSNSEFPPPQMPLSQSMLEQSKVRQQRNQARKAHNVAKRASQKEQEKWLKAELPENVHGMRSAVHAHCLFLLKVRNKNFSSLPTPRSTEEREISIQVAGNLGYFPKDVFNEPSTQVQSQGFQSYCENELHKLGLKRFTWNWESSWQHPFNELMSMVFYRTFRLALVSTKNQNYCWNKDHNSYGVVAALMKQYFTYLKREWKSIQKDAEYFVKKKENQKLAKIRQRVS
ncbi:hypothetical protein O181_108452 [Austropuccinia psidii MF-1]|uniref:Uncharacterized protein n=1 Tax=Austropuccinia psidii MF-1 TaxID=1389203 RepID=A0A9Q3JU80_9BASI|nr:hypothetical protein [Austropuccinia psidii MF-1]